MSRHGRCVRTLKLEEVTMRRRRLAIISGILALLLVVASVGYVWYEHEMEEAEKAEPEFPPALGRHLERLKEAVPGNGGESQEGPWSGAEAEFLARAYPGDTISIAQMEAARTAFTNAT